MPAVYQASGYGNLSSSESMWFRRPQKFRQCTPVSGSIEVTRFPAAVRPAQIPLMFQSTTCMELPYDIWKKIVSYLPVGQAKKLYAVNRMLFGIAMDLRYSEARLWAGGSKAQLRKDLRVFCYPHLSSRPKTLHIDLSSIAKALPQTNSNGGCFTSLGRLISSVKKEKFIRLNSVYDIVAAGLEALPGLTRVTKLDVVYDYNGAYHHDPLVVQLLQKVWQILGNQLRFLNVKVISDNLELLFPVSLHLPSLQMLTIVAEGVSSVTATAFEFVIPAIIKSHASTLLTVAFTTDNAVINPLPIFESLQVLRCLQVVHISFPFGPLIPRPLPAYNMLYIHQHHLESLSLDFSAFMPRGKESYLLPLFNEDWCSVGLPNLEELRINPPVGTVVNRDFIDYVHRFAPSLISLWLKSNVLLSYNETVQLSSIFPDFSSLRTLGVCIRLFCPQLLALLAQTLPCLRSLNLRYSEITITTDEFSGYGFLTELFYRGMQPYIHMFREWQLMSLNYYCISRSFHTNFVDIERALADHLPNVEWFCGVDRLTYLSQAPGLPSTIPNWVMGK